MVSVKFQRLVKFLCLIICLGIVYLVYVANKLLLEYSILRHYRKFNTHGKKLILIYTALFGEKPWPWAPPDYNFTELDGSACSCTNCIVTYDHLYLKTSDFVLFHGRDLPDVHKMRRLRKVNARQSWIFFMHESPHNTFVDIAEYNNLFNLTMTYRADSDIFLPYHNNKFNPKKTNSTKNWAEGKTKLITFVNSHCDKMRMDFIRKLKKYIEVDVYGRCSQFFPDRLPKCPRNSKSCKDIQRQYKFYLAFENGFCTDYITEKYWINGLNSTLVPVVIGGANYSNSKLAIQGSYINGLDFHSLKDLAKHLLYLDRNDREYNKYHQWRYTYDLVARNMLCKLCKSINSGETVNKTVDLKTYWGIERNCFNHEDILKNFT